MPLDQPLDRDAGELAGDQRVAAQRRQLQAAEEAVLDVLGDRLAGAHRREQRSLHERQPEREAQIGVGRKAREMHAPR